MGYKKKDVYGFIQKCRSKALNSVYDKYNTKIKEYKTEQIDDKLNLVLEKITSSITCLNNFIDEENKDGVKINLKTCYDVRQFMSYANNIKRNIMNVYYDEKVQQLEKEKENKLDKVGAEYTKLETVCRNLHTAKDCYLYLHKIGFDVSYLDNIEEHDQKMLVQSVDKEALFVCGDNK